MAEILDISQKTVAHYEVARLLISLEMLTTLAAKLGVSIEQLLGDEETNTPAHKAAKRDPTPLLERQMAQVSQQSRAKQEFVSEMLDTVIQQAGN